MDDLQAAFLAASQSSKFTSLINIERSDTALTELEGLTVKYYYILESARQEISDRKGASKKWQ